MVLIFISLSSISVFYAYFSHNSFIVIIESLYKHNMSSELAVRLSAKFDSLT